MASKPLGAWIWFVYGVGLELDMWQHMDLEVVFSCFFSVELSQVVFRAIC